MTLFEKKCIEDTSIEEIAKHAGVGAATVYRYFSTKIELVIETAGHYWEQVAGKYLTELERAESVSLKKWSGYQRLEQILHIFCRIFEEEKAFLKFLQEFDVFVKKYEISQEGLSDYERWHFEVETICDKCTGNRIERWKSCFCLFSR